MEITTISCYSSFIYLENFFCVNRSYLIPDRRKRIFCNIICILAFSAVIVDFVDDVVNSEIDINEKMFQGVLAVEFLTLALAARYRSTSFAALKRLDEKCGVEKKIIDQLKKKVHKETFVAMVSVAIDIVGIYFIEGKTVQKLTYAIMYAVHEAETIFFALIIEGINLRLMKLNEATPSVGSRVYRHVLLASSQMNIEFTARVSEPTNIIYEKLDVRFSKN